MAISTNSIIHYTESFDVLCKILDEGFKIKYCLENLSLISKGKGSSAAHPMVSFCDIPLSETNKHFESYGCYGIGLYKEWALRNGLNPVLYIEKNSSIAISLSNMLQKVRDGSLADIEKDIYRLKAFTKNYSGELHTNNIDVLEYRFYNEKEWRFIPQRQEINGKTISVSGSKYKADKQLYNNKLSNIRLKFTPLDISYIIVKNTDEIPRLISYLKDKYYDKCTAKDLDILLTKICSVEQIQSDY